MSSKYQKMEVNNLYFQPNRKPSTEYDFENKFAPINVDAEGNKVKMVRLDQIDKLNQEQVVEEDSDFEETPFFTTRHQKPDIAVSLYGEILDPESAYIAEEDRKEEQEKEDR